VEAKELVVVVEEEGLTTLDVVSHCDVEHDYPRMGVRELGSELAPNEFSVRANAPLRVSDAKANLCVSNASLSLFIN
jgi:hypothetical protein